MGQRPYRVSVISCGTISLASGEDCSGLENKSMKETDLMEKGCRKTSMNFQIIPHDYFVALYSVTSPAQLGNSIWEASQTNGMARVVGFSFRWLFAMVCF